MHYKTVNTTFYFDLTIFRDINQKATSKDFLHIITITFCVLYFDVERTEEILHSSCAVYAYIVIYTKQQLIINL